MAIQSLKNQYQGINAHLHSHLQAHGGWASFHTAHISDLNKTLKAQLLPMGYTAELEPSVQIRRLDESLGNPESDVAVYDLDPLRPLHLSEPRAGQVGELVMPLVDLIAENPLSEKTYSAVAIYEKHHAGDLVAWLELLSPSNKGNSEDARHYREKRLNLLRGGVVFIELDYLHETQPTFFSLANYRRHDPNAYAYRIVVIDPRPDFENGQAYIREFDVDAPIPEIDIPLNAGDVLHFDFGIPYRKTFEEMLYGLELIDYHHLPANFKRYSPTDQLRIITRMLTVLAADNLENAPLPLLPPPNSIEEGLQLLA